MFISACLLTTLSELTAKLATQERHHALVEDQRACACASSFIPTPPPPSPHPPPPKIVVNVVNRAHAQSQLFFLRVILSKWVICPACHWIWLFLKWSGSTLIHLMLLILWTQKKHKLNGKTSMAEKTRATPVDVCSLLVSLRIVWN